MNSLATDWANFFVAEVGASAALTGLVVVAISVNLSRILAFEQLPGRALEAIVTLAGTLVVTSLGLVPNQPGWLFGAEVFVVGLVAFMVPVGIQLRSLASMRNVTTRKKLTRVVISAVASLAFLGSGVCLMAGLESGLYGLAAGVILSLVAGVWHAWVLLIEILR